MSSNPRNSHYNLIINKLDDTQRNAVLSNRAMVVCAGAGSGKTRVLVAKYLYYAIELKIPLQSIIALTFTKKAANEMYERIYRVLTQCAPEYPHIASQLQSFDGSAISTIDSYCHGLVSQHYRYLNIEQSPTIDRGKYIVMAQHVAYKTILRYSTFNPIQQLGYSKGMQALLQDALVALALDNISFVHPIDPQQSLASVKRILQHAMNNCLHNIMQNIEVLQPYSTTVKALHPIASFIPRHLEQLSIISPLEQCVEIIAPIMQLTARFGKTHDIDHLKPLIKQTKQQAQQLCDIMSYSSYSSDHQCVLEMLLDFQTSLNHAKQVSGLLMYHNFLELSIHILNNLKLHPHIQCQALLVDEFQDVNTPQKTLIYLIANRSLLAIEDIQSLDKEQPNPRSSSKNDQTDVLLQVPSYYPLCIVGDERQSIYGFRGAEHDVFRVVMADINAIGGEIHFLANNYRTHSELYRLVSLLEQRAHATLQYVKTTEFQSTAANNTNRIKLHTTQSYCSISIINTNDEPNRSSENALVPSLDADIIETDANFSSNSTYPEARYIAEMIQQQVTSDTFRIFDGNQVRAVRYSDYAILLRTRTRLQLFEKELRASRIPFSTISTHSSSQQFFLYDYFNLLQSVINPRDYASFVAVLKSPWVAFDDANILEVHTELMKKLHSTPRTEYDSLYSQQHYQYILALIDERVANFFEQVTKKISRYTSLQLIDWLWFDMCYRSQLLQTESEEYVEYVYRTLFNLANHCMYPHQLLYYLRAHINLTTYQTSAISTYDIPRFQTQQHDGVVLSTIHAAKGLEYPVVIVADMNATMRHETSRIIWPFDSNQYSVQYPKTNVLFELTKEKRKYEIDNELIRLFYVAITRAQSHLILCGTVDSSPKAHTLLSLLGPLNTISDISIEYVSASAIVAGDTMITSNKPNQLSSNRSAKNSTSNSYHESPSINTDNHHTTHSYTHHFTHSFDVNATTLNAWYNQYQTELTNVSQDVLTNNIHKTTATNSDKSTTVSADYTSSHRIINTPLPSLPIDEVLTKQSLHNAFGSLVHTCFCQQISMFAIQQSTLEQIVDINIGIQRTFPPSTHQALKKSLLDLLNIFVVSQLYRQQILDIQQSYDIIDESTHTSLHPVHSASNSHSPFDSKNTSSTADAGTGTSNELDYRERNYHNHPNQSSNNNKTHHIRSFVLSENKSVERVVHHERPFIFSIHQRYADLTITGTIDYLHHDTIIEHPHVEYSNSNIIQHSNTSSNKTILHTSPSPHSGLQLTANRKPASSIPQIQSQSPVLVDYKSDAIIKPEIYRMQMACYQQACHTMYGVYPRTYLYYVRSGDTVEVPIQYELFSALQRYEIIARLYSYLVK